MITYHDLLSAEMCPAATSIVSLQGGKKDTLLRTFLFLLYIKTIQTLDAV
jgi:hypothetical protein